MRCIQVFKRKKASVFYPLLSILVTLFFLGIFNSCSQNDSGSASFSFSITKDFANKVFAAAQNSLWDEFSDSENIFLEISLRGGYQDSKTIPVKEGAQVVFENIDSGITIVAEAVAYKDENGKRLELYAGQSKPIVTKAGMTVLEIKMISLTGTDTVTYTVKFMTSDETCFDTQIVEEDSCVQKPEEPEMDGLTFLGWYTSPDGVDAYDFFEPVKEDITLYAVFCSLVYQEASWDAEGKKVTYSKKGLSEGDYTTLSSSSTAWNGGWYAAEGDVTIEDRITVSGEVHLILCDGATLTANKGITLSAGGNSLTIYAQEEGTGKLEAKEYQVEDDPEAGPEDEVYAAGIGGIGGGPSSSENELSCGSLTIHGGIVNAVGSAESCGIGTAGTDDAIGGGTVTIYGGTITATGGGGAAGIGGRANGGSLCVYGGTINAKGNSWGAGIGGGFRGAGGTVKIYGGSVTAEGSENSAGIGGGGSSGSGGGAGDSFEIYGGTVIAKGAGGNPGIGGGDRNNSHGTFYVGEGLRIVAGTSESTAVDSSADEYSSARSSYIKITDAD